MGFDNQLRRELIEEENAKLMFYMERHLRWAKSSDESTLARQQRVIAETLKQVYVAPALLAKVKKASEKTDNREE